MKIDICKSHILNEIVVHKKAEVAQMHQELPLTYLQQQLNVNTPETQNFLFALQQNSHRPSLIAEVKKASPSKGVIKKHFDAVEIARAYEQSGTACISVLTDQKFFQGSFNNLRNIRAAVKIPLLCKEFIIDPYQIYLARKNGADAVLLIAAILKDTELQTFSLIIRNLGMTALVEVHTLEELDRALKIEGVSLIGINNRNLEDFTVDIYITQQLLNERKQQIQNLNITIVSESGLHTPADLSLVASSGARAVLVGESLVKQNNIGQAVQTLLSIKC